MGDVHDVGCWSGIPFHFWRAAVARGIETIPLRVDMERLRFARLAWNGIRSVTGKAGGFQYSKWCLDAMEAQIKDEQWGNEIITFNQHFPRSSTVLRNGGAIHHYLDAPFAALSSGRGLELKLPKRIVLNACSLERENYAASTRVITMARWAADAIVNECDVPSSKVNVILPGANLDVPETWKVTQPEGRPGVERPFTMGFIGKDWQRKGLPLLLEVQKDLTRRGWNCRVLAAGNAPTDLRRAQGIEFVGYIDKSRGVQKILNFLNACDIGCLFSQREALGISTLEFLRASVPVAGFDHEGPADTIPPDAGFRFPLHSNATEIACAFAAYLENEEMQERFRISAEKWSKLVTWERCVREFQELRETGSISKPVQPWNGLGDFSAMSN
jgi:glycosyltransferase involved in cell wall biosynthesis